MYVCAVVIDLLLMLALLSAEANNRRLLVVDRHSSLSRILKERDPRL